MLKVLLVLVGICCTQISIAAGPSEDLLQNLRLRIHGLPSGSGSLIKSFTNHTQSYIYDQALAIIAFTQEGDRAHAEKLLKGLASLQLSDGSLYFSYYLDGKSPYPIEGDKRFAGAIAWVALAATHYQQKFKSKEYLEFNRKILSFLESQMHPIILNGVKTKAVVFAPNDIPATSWKENNIAALEHNLDAYSAFIHFSKINQDQRLMATGLEIQKFILGLWDKGQNHFWSGANINTGEINKSEFYLDNQSWSLLALDQSLLKELKPIKALKKNCDSLFVKHHEVEGFMDSKPTRRPAAHKFVWSEGTLGQILAMNKIGRIHKKEISCQGKNSIDYLKNMYKLKKSDGGIAYSTPTPNPDFTNSSSVAGTAWLYFAVNNFNPFHIDEIN